MIPCFLLRKVGEKMNFENENEQHDIQKKAMEWVNKMVKDWIRNGDDLEEIFNKGWLRYGLVVYRVKNSKKNSSG